MTSSTHEGGWKYSWSRLCKPSDVSRGCLTFKNEARKILEKICLKNMSEHKKSLPIILAHLSNNKSVRNILASLQQIVFSGNQKFSKKSKGIWDDDIFDHRINCYMRQVFVGQAITVLCSHHAKTSLFVREHQIYNALPKGSILNFPEEMLLLTKLRDAPKTEGFNEQR